MIQMNIVLGIGRFQLTGSIEYIGNKKQTVWSTGWIIYLKLQHRPGDFAIW